MKSCLICDDHTMMRESLAGLVESNWPNSTLTLAKDYPSAWLAIAERPDLCVSDLIMPGAKPVAGISRMRETAPEVPILIVTGNEEDDLLLQLFNLGISGFVPKTSPGAIVEAAINVVLAGETYIPERILALASSSAPPVGPVAELAVPRLTERQSDVLKLISGGLSNKEVARELDLSPATVKAHAAAALAALGASNRAEGVFKAREFGVI